MESDLSGEALPPADQETAPTNRPPKRLPKMVNIIEDAVSKCSIRKGVTPMYIRNYILGKYPQLDSQRFRFTFQKAFQTAIENNILLRTKATETARGLSGRVKLAAKGKPPRKAQTPSASKESSNPSSKTSLEKTKNDDAVGATARANKTIANKPPEVQKKHRAGAKKAAAADTTTRDSTTVLKKALRSASAATKVVKSTTVPVSKAQRRRGAATKRGKESGEKTKAGEKEDVPVAKKVMFIDVEHSGKSRSFGSAGSAADQSDGDDLSDDAVSQTARRVTPAQCESNDSPELQAEEGHESRIETTHRSDTAPSTKGKISANEKEATAGEGAQSLNTIRIAEAKRRPGKKVARKKLAGPKKTATTGPSDYSGTENPTDMSSTQHPANASGSTGDLLDPDNKMKAKNRAKPVRRAKK